MRVALLSLFSLFIIVRGEVTIYTQIPLGGGSPTTTTKSWPSATNAAEYDPVTLTVPAAPTPAIGGSSVVQILTGGMDKLSHAIPKGYLGFSIELSVADQVLGRNGTFLNPEFLNLLQTISNRAGRAVVRVGGNSQERAIFFPEGLSNGQTIIKDKSNLKNPTDTPELQVGIDLFFAMGNISSLTNTDWFIGLPFTPSAPRFGIGEAGERILGDHLLGLQIGNEPDLFANHGDRDSTYGPSEYLAELQQMARLMQSNSNLQNPNAMIVPSTCCEWGPMQLQELGFMDQFASQMKYLSVEKYPQNNCPDDQGNRKDAQSLFAEYLTHESAQSFASQFADVSALATQYNKPVIMMETNTASCAGFPGLSDSFGAAMWIIDTSLQLAYYNFSGSLLHVGGQNTYYNPFTPPPGASLKRGALWTVGAPYYAAMITAEILGSSGESQVLDVFPNNGNPLTPGYVVYENGNPVRAVFINYVTDLSGANDYTAQIAIDGNGVGKANASPAQIYVRYFTSNSTASKLPFYYANQTFGATFESNGILKGTKDTKTIPCDMSTNLCSVKIPAPSVAVVFFSQDAVDKSVANGDSPVTFSTTVTSIELHNTATIDAAVLATSNGRGGLMNQIGSTSIRSNDARNFRDTLPGSMALLGICLSFVFIGRLNLV